MLIKRTFDIFASFCGLILLSPVALIIAILVKISSRGPAFYLQKRVGKEGNLFTCIKFRTMYTGADRQGSITASSDARITTIGKFLRRFKLDELPQLWNVFIGRMSFVGPRPDVPGYADMLTGDNRRVLKLRPGITGPATLYFRYEEELLCEVEDKKKFNDEVIWPKKVQLNKEYHDHWGFWKDIGYILITILPSLDKWMKLVDYSPRHIANVANPVREIE